jgi:glycosyltransferase involved in cell wall biosynthesis
MPELIEDGVTGFLVPRDDEAGMGARLDGLLDDPRRAAAMGAAARAKMAREQSLEATVDAYERLYARLVEAGLAVSK